MNKYDTEMSKLHILPISSDSETLHPTCLDSKNIKNK